MNFLIATTTPQGAGYDFAPGFIEFLTLQSHLWFLIFGVIIFSLMVLILLKIYD